MRSWLNGYGAEANGDGKDYSDNNFLNYAFTEGEQSAIKTTNVINSDNPEYGTGGGNDTLDKVYLLSIDEVVNPAYGFTSDTDETVTRNAVNTAYVAGGGEIDCSNIFDMDSAGSSDDWWLRSSGGGYGNNAYYVSRTGSASRPSYLVYFDDFVVRPALHLNLKALSDAISTSSWSYAGTVTTDNKVEWDCVWFGNYWQEDTNGDGKADKNDEKQPIKWRVLSVDGEDAFLIADKSLDYQKYNDTETIVTWETCTIRSWLNGYGAGANKEGEDYGSNNFLVNAFSAGEQSAIQTTNVLNNNNPRFDIKGGNDTSDKVYLLSLDEVKNPGYGFSSNYNKYDENRRTKYTGYAKEQGGISTEYAGNGSWWLRSPGFDSGRVVYVDSRGYVRRHGYYVGIYSVGVRPALHLNLKASSDGISTSSWSYAGTVTSEEGGKEEATPQPTKPGSTQKPDTSAVPVTTEDPVQTGKSSPKPSDNPDIDPTTEPSSKPDVKPSDAPGAGPTFAPGSFPPTITPGIQPSASPDAISIGNVSAVKLKQKKQSVTVSWKKVPGAAGYQICYSTSKKWKNKKQKLSRKNKLIVKKLKKKKTYYFRVRAYRMNGAKKVYGAWSKAKKVKIKK